MELSKGRGEGDEPLLASAASMDKALDEQPIIAECTVNDAQIVAAPSYLLQGTAAGIDTGVQGTVVRVDGVAQGRWSSGLCECCGDFPTLCMVSW